MPIYAAFRVSSLVPLAYGRYSFALISLTKAELPSIALLLMRVTIVYVVQFLHQKLGHLLALERE